MNQPIQHHSTRDHRFAYISAGDISHWAKSTSGFKRPDPKRQRRDFNPVTNLELLRSAAAKLTVGEAVHDPQKVVLLCSDDDGGVLGAIKKCEKVVRIANERTAISDMMNRILMPNKFTNKPIRA